MRSLLGRLHDGVAAVCVLPLLLIYATGLVSFLSCSRLAALVPGSFGIRVRRHWYGRTLDACGSRLIVEWLAAFKTPHVRVGNDVYVGPMAWIAEADLEDDVMVGARTAIQGGARQHGFDRLDVPMREQDGVITKVRIGPDVMINTGAIVLADVAPGTVVAAGAVVTRTFPPLSVLAGVPARVVRTRGEGEAVGEREHHG